MHVAGAPYDFKFAIKSQKRLQQILLGPESLLVKNPFSCVLCGEEDVVNMNENTDLQTRIRLFTSLRLELLDRLALQHEIRRIGDTKP